MTKRRVTREDVAKLAGTSVAVVSYVVNDGPRPVSKATRQRVLDAIAVTGYRPNGIAKALAAGATDTYGLIVPDISNPFFAALAHAIEDEAYERGKVVLLGDSGEDEARELDLINIFQQRRIDGLLYIGVDGKAQLTEILAGGIPVVILDRVEDDGGAGSVFVDNFNGAKAATQHLIDLGHERIAIVRGPKSLSTADDRLQGWKEAMQTAGLSVGTEWQYEAPFSRQGGLAAWKHIYESPARPQAIFASNEQQAIGILHGMAEVGLRVPEDFALVSFDGTADGEYSVPPLTTIAQPIDQIARDAIRLLIEPQKFKSKRITHPFTLIVRDSCGARRATGIQ